MGRGSSKAGGGGGGKAVTKSLEEQKQEFIDEMVQAVNNSNNLGTDEDMTPMSNSDIQAAVEAFAMTHPGVNEESLLSEINSKVTPQSVSGKPFNANDWTTWTVGTKVEAKNDDVYSNGKVAANGPKKWIPGTVTEVHKDYIIVTDNTNTKHYVDKDFAERYRVKK